MTPRFVLLDERGLTVARVDLVPDDAENVSRVLEQRMREPFDLERGPPIRVELLTLGADRTLLLVAAHHIVLDGSSSRLLIADLVRAYGDLEAGRSCDLDWPEGEYSDFVTWQRDVVGGPQGATDRAYWTRQLSGAIPLDGLPRTRPWTRDLKHQGAVVAVTVPAARLAAVAGLLQREGVSKAAFFLAVFQVLLSRYTGQRDIVVGMPSTLRPQERFDGIIGHFVNMLPIRNEVPDGEAFSIHLARVQGTIAAALDHAAYPFSSIVSDLAAHGQDASSPIFQVSFNFQGFLAETPMPVAVTEAGTSFEQIHGLHQAGEYELGLDILPHEGTTFVFKYHPQIYDRTVIEGMARHFLTLIDAAVADPSTAVNALQWLPAAERAAILGQDDATARDYGSSVSLEGLIAEQVRSRPDAPAVTFGDITLTYRQLDDAVARLARRLIRDGVDATTVVGVCVERSLDMVVALLAVMRAGAAYVPLDPRFPAVRLSQMTERAGCRFILTQRALAPRLDPSAGQARILLVGAADGSDPGGDIADAAGELAYVMFTSGSTGQPKGVMVTRSALVNFLLSMRENLGCSEDDRWLAVTTYGFDIAALELYLPLVTGGHCVICGADVVRNADLLRREIAVVRPTFMQATPASWSMLFRVGWRNSERVRLLCGGEALSDNLRRLFVESGSHVWNMYGPTETTIWSTMGVVKPDGAVTVGTPIANTRVYVLDERLQPVTYGVAGELCIAGDGLALGYRDDPDQTARRFVQSPFRPGERLYRTGDRARRRHDGEIEIVGRADDQVKVRGFRIELGEIEGALNRHPAVEGSAVVVSEASGVSRLSAFVVTGRNDQATPDSAALRTFLMQTLPEHMIPAEFTRIGAFPLTPNGKVDRKQLLTQVAGAQAAGHRGPATPEVDDIEARVDAAFRNALASGAFTRDDRFFDIGGDSISAIAVVEQVNAEFGCRLSVTALFRCPTVASLSALVHEARATGHPGIQADPPDSDERSVLPRDSAPPTARLPGVPENALAIVGISCQFPGAEDHRQFWDNLVAGRAGTRLVPLDELEAAGVPPSVREAPNYVPQQAEVAGKAEFDAAFFNISPRDAEFMDPQARLLLQNAWRAIEDAGYNVEDVPDTSVFMSTSNNHYQTQIPGLRPDASKPRIMDDAGDYVAWLLSQGGSTPTMVSNKLGLTGPSLHVSTNCSSALAGFHLACQGLLAGEVDQALVGAAAIFPATGFGYLHQPGLNFSSDGRCKVFDEDADGMVGGEGAAVIMVKRARDAIAAGDNVYALVRGVAINNDGSAKAGFYAPSIQGQTAVIRKVIDKTSVDPATISYVEAHGTGTRIGDPIEVAALTEAYRHYTQLNRYCGIGSVKSNIGHLDAAAGMAGIIKVALSLYHEKIPPTLHYERPNPEIDFEYSPFYVVTSVSDLRGRGTEPARAALSSFGIGGTNGHAILERCPRPTGRADAVRETGPVIVPLSAQNEERLAACAAALLEALPACRRAGNRLADVAYTLQIGRRPMACRAVAIVADFDALADALAALSARTSLPPFCLAGGAGREPAAGTPGPDIDAGLWRRAAAWIDGDAGDWGPSPPGARRISLPGYAFARKRYALACPPPASSAFDPLERLERRAERTVGEGLGQMHASGSAAAAADEYRRCTSALDDVLAGLLLHQIAEAGVFGADGLAPARAFIEAAPRSLARWLAHGLESLAGRGILERRGRFYRRADDRSATAGAWDAWRSWKAAAGDRPEVRDRVDLIEVMTAAIPDILAGTARATEVMFPSSSFHLVEGLYKRDPIARCVNAALADAVLAIVRSRPSGSTAGAVRIVEIGAGTGGTSDLVLDALARAGLDIGEYAYTDLSRAFLDGAERRLRARHPALHCRRLDIERPVAEQGFEPGTYDIAIATNVLHATRHVRQSLAHVSSLLRAGGVLLLNEISDNSLTMHATFGLLEGWWRFEDGERRLPGGPALSGDGWARALREAGFRSVRRLGPASEPFGLQLIAAEAGAREAAGVEGRRQAPRAPLAATDHRPMAAAGIASAVTTTLAASLKMDPSEISPDVSFSDYGLDSLAAVAVLDELKRALRVALHVSDLFDHPTVAKLTEHVSSLAPDPGALPAGRPRAVAGGGARQTGCAERIVEDAVTRALSSVLKMDEDDIAVETPFADYGLDSLTAVEVVRRLTHSLALDLDVTEVFDHPTVAALARHLSGACSVQRGPRGEPIRPAQRALARERAPAFPEPIAIVGMSGRFPQADDVDGLWHHLARGSDLVEPVTRWDHAAVGADCPDGGFMRDIDRFDPLFFNISGLEAAYMEPQQRLFLEEAWKALEDAGYAGVQIDSLRCGVYVGCTTGDYFDLSRPADYPAQAFWGNMSSIVPARISYYLNLHGPALAVDTACSSSLVAVHLACQALRNGEVAMALAGGVFVQCSPRLYIAGSRAGMLSRSGRCKAFDDAADGFVPAEGIGVLVLKRLSDAIDARDQIHAVIRGSGLNQDGTTNGITAPSAKSQQDLQEQVYDAFGIDCADIHLMEAHGTGTKLGDPIEFQALARSFRGRTELRNFCALGSSKSNLGHTQMAAGVVGIIKTVMSLRHEQIPPTLHYDRCNTNIALDDSPFYINTGPVPWPARQGRRRCAAVSSFGASGTNGHVVIEEAPARPTRVTGRRERAIVLSARTGEQLRMQAGRLAAFCSAHPAVDLGDVSYTLALGRRHFPYRLAVVVSDLEQLRDALMRWSAGEAVPTVLGGERAKPAGAAGPAPTGRVAPAVLAAYYAAGGSVDWDSVFIGESCGRISLPTYPFARDRCWLPDEPVEPRAAPLPASPDADAATVLTGDEYFLRHHRVQGRPILPGALYLELARTALAAGRQPLRDACAALSNLVFLNPVVVAGPPVAVRVASTGEGGRDFDISSAPDGEKRVHCRGEIRPAAPRPPAIDIVRLRERHASRHVGSGAFYDHFAEIGIDYGTSFRVVVQAFVSPGSVLAELRAPEELGASLDSQAFHPAMVDGALQCLKLLSGGGEAPARPNLLFAIREASAFAPCTPSMWAWLRPAGDGPGDRVDIDIADDCGRVCVALRGVMTRPVEPDTRRIPSVDPLRDIGLGARTRILTPAWVPVAPATTAPSRRRAGAVVVANRGGRSPDTLRSELAHAATLDVSGDVEAIARQLGAMPPVDHLIWFGAAAARAPRPAEDMAAAENGGALEVFRLCKALLQAGYATRTLSLTLVTEGVQRVRPDERTDPTQAGVSGLAGTIAKEYPNWAVRAADVARVDATSFKAVLALEADPDGNTRAYRDGRWLEQRLHVRGTDSLRSCGLPAGGVYVIAGGAGGLGRALSAHLIRRYRAQVVWLGRSERDAAIDAHVAALAVHGPAPLYLRADICDRDALRRAHAEISRRFGRVTGLIQSALVFGGASLDRMTESAFRAVLDAKVAGSAHFVEEFRNEPLDLVLFVSSLNSYLKAIGQAHYAAACTFKDAFAMHLARELPGAVKVINLSYCFNNVDLADRKGNSGDIDFITEEEFILGIERLISENFDQMSLINFSAALNTRGIKLGEGSEAPRPASDPRHAGGMDDETETLRRIRERMGALNALAI